MPKDSVGLIYDTTSSSWSVLFKKDTDTGVYVDYFKHFITSNSDEIITSQVSGAGAANNPTTDTTYLSRIDSTTGTTTTGRAAIQGANTMVRLTSTERWFNERIIRTGASAFDGTEQGTVRVGFIDSATGESTEAAMFRYGGTSNGNFIAVTRSANVETGTATDTGVAVATGTYYRLSVYWDGTSVRYYIDDVLVATHTTNIWSTAPSGVGCMILKSAGTNARVVGSIYNTIKHQFINA